MILLKNSFHIFQKKIVGAIVLGHYYMHKIDYKERQMLAYVLGIKEQEVPIGVK